MEDFTAWLLEFLKSGALKFITIGSLVLFVVTPLIIPIILLRLPPDFLIKEPHESVRPPMSKWLMICLRIIRNFIGVVLMVLGFILLFMPGQGILTFLAGMLLIDLPGRRTMIHRILGKPSVLRAVNRLRLKRNHPPLISESTLDGSQGQSRD